VDSPTLTPEQLKSIITAAMEKSSERLNEAYGELGKLLSTSISPYLLSKSLQSDAESGRMLPCFMQATWVNPSWIS
jgi:hypothetical protein